jgi:hypothetical protein
MFDWVGGRTSEMSAVGLLPAALQVGNLWNSGFDMIFSHVLILFIYFGGYPS